MTRLFILLLLFLSVFIGRLHGQAHNCYFEISCYDGKDVNPVDVSEFSLSLVATINGNPMTLGSGSIKFNASFGPKALFVAIADFQGFGPTDLRPVGTPFVATFRQTRNGKVIAEKVLTTTLPAMGGDSQWYESTKGGICLESTLPKPEIAVAGAAFCSNATGTRTVTATITNAPSDMTTGGYTVDWNHAGISGNTFTLKPGTTDTYTVTGTLDASITATTAALTPKLMKAGTAVATGKTTYKITVNIPETLSIDVKTTPICSGKNFSLEAKLSAGTGSNFKWTCDGTQVGTNATLSITAPAVAGNKTYKVTAKDRNSCDMTEVSKQVTINETPVLTGLTADPTTVKVGETVDLKAEPNHFTTYTWSGGTGLAAGTGATTTATPTAAGTPTYQVIATAANGCKSAAQTVTVTVEAAGPELVVSPTIPTTVCIGNGTAQLDAGASKGTAPYTYQWVVTGTITLSALDIEKPTITNTTAATGTIYVKVTDSSTPAVTKQSTPVNVTVNAKPTLSNITPAQTIEAGQTAALSVTVAPAGTTCTWSGGPFSGGVNTGTTVTAAPTAVGTTTYNVTAGATGCQATLSTTVTVNGTPVPGDCPTLTLSVSPMVCATTAGTATRMITITGTGPVGTTYSFKVKDINGVETPYNGAGPFFHSVTEAKRGLHSITELKVTKAGGGLCDGTVPASMDVQFYDLPAAPGVQGATQLAVGQYSLAHCGNDPLILKGTGASGLNFTWTPPVQDGQPFIPAGNQNYTVTATNANGCSAQSTLALTINPKPTVTAQATPTEICRGESVILNSGGDAINYLWSNGGADNTPLTPLATTKYIVTGTAANGCKDTASVTVVVNTAPEIIRQSRDRTIAIGRDADFSVEALGNGLTYQWERMENGIWIQLTDGTGSFPQISGATTDKVLLSQVPRTWDNTKLRCLVGNRCDTVAASFNLFVKECFDITGDITMGGGIRPDDVPGDAIDGWFCLGTRITLNAKITPEDPANPIENPRYKWVIDGEPANKVIEQDSSVLTWIPEFWEDDIVVKVGVYSDGACDTVYSRYLRLKARPFDDATVKIVASIDPERAACPDERIDLTVATTNAGADPKFQWYNSIFNLGTGKNKTLTMTEATWIKVIMTPSPEVCVGDRVLADSIHIVLKQPANPTLKITNSINDTLACAGDEITFKAIYDGAGQNPVIHWQKDVWNLGYGQQVTTKLDNKDINIKCELIPSKDVCYTGDTMVVIMTIRVLENSSVSIFSDMDGKKPGDDLTFTSKVENMPVNPLYEWFVNGNLTNEPSDTYISNVLRQSDVVVLAVKGERICQTRVYSNEIVVNFNKASRDTMVEIYKDERISKLNMFKTGDEHSAFMMTEMPKYGMAVMFPNGLFDYYPNPGFMGQDFVKYVVMSRYDKTKIEEGYIYITVKGSSRYFIPNIITPNEDGMNDKWELDFLSEYPDHIVTVYNWQSKIVFQAKNYQNDWDGKGQTATGYVGQVNLPNGIYTYVIDLGNKVILKGWIEIRGGFNRSHYR